MPARVGQIELVSRCWINTQTSDNSLYILLIVFLGGVLYSVQYCTIWVLKLGLQNMAQWNKSDDEYTKHH